MKWKIAHFVRWHTIILAAPFQLVEHGMFHLHSHKHNGNDKHKHKYKYKYKENKNTHADRFKSEEQDHFKH